MGSTRGWVADKEDEITTCRHGEESRYFEKCRCDGCVMDVRHAEARGIALAKLHGEIDAHLSDLSHKKYLAAVDKLREKLL